MSRNRGERWPIVQQLAGASLRGIQREEAGALLQAKCTPWFHWMPTGYATASAVNLHSGPQLARV
jgi:hypothetical protein